MAYHKITSFLLLFSVNGERRKLYVDVEYCLSGTLILA